MVVFRWWWFSSWWGKTWKNHHWNENHHHHPHEHGNFWGSFSETFRWFVEYCNLAWIWESHSKSGAQAGLHRFQAAKRFRVTFLTNLFYSFQMFPDSHICRQLAELVFWISGGRAKWASWSMQRRALPRQRFDVARVCLKKRDPTPKVFRKSIMSRCQSCHCMTLWAIARAFKQCFVDLCCIEMYIISSLPEDNLTSWQNHFASSLEDQFLNRIHRSMGLKMAMFTWPFGDKYPSFSDTPKSDSVGIVYYSILYIIYTLYIYI